MNRSLVLVLALTLTASLIALGLYMHSKSQDTVPSSVRQLFNEWKGKHQKLYGANEEDSRLTVFYENYKKVQKHQSDPNRTWDMGYTVFMDLTPEEFKATYLTAKVNTTQTNVTHLPLTNLQDGVNWVTKGAVGPVKNQGQCGSCWSFSTTGALEGLSFITGRGLPSFSEQELVDCTGNFGNHGCQGGYVDNAFNFVQTYGIMSESSYPYEGYQGQCRYTPTSFKVRGHVDVPSGDTNQLAAAVNQQPVSIAVDANNWQLYAGGVFTNCGQSLDHAVLLVGYTSQYWIVKNSWGTQWGYSGYIYLGGGNTCGLANAASYPVA